jgi:hypothetical protein
MAEAGDLRPEIGGQESDAGCQGRENHPHNQGDQCPLNYEGGIVVNQRVYIETTIPSYLAAWPTRDLVQAARQQITHNWWNNHRHNYDLCISQTVIDEAEAGDVDAAKRRMLFLHDFPLLDLTEAVNDVAKAIMDSGLLPPRATRDAIHISVSSVHGIDILLTWNCRQIANAAIMKDLGSIVAKCGYEMPILCTPDELLGD